MSRQSLIIWSSMSSLSSIQQLEWATDLITCRACPCRELDIVQLTLILSGAIGVLHCLLSFHKTMVETIKECANFSHDVAN